MYLGFFDFKRKKVSERELSNDLCFAKPKHILSAKRQFRDSIKKGLVHLPEIV